MKLYSFILFIGISVFVFALSAVQLEAKSFVGWKQWSTQKGPHTIRFDGVLSDSLYAVVQYGTTIQMDRSVRSKTKNLEQSVFLTNLEPDTTYYYILGIEDDSGTRTTAETASSFTTASAGKPEVPEKDIPPDGTIPIGITINLPGPSYTAIGDFKTPFEKMPSINRVDVVARRGSARATCVITSTASKDDWGASQIEYGLTSEKQPFQEQFNWGYRDSWCKKEVTLNGLPSAMPIFFRVFAVYRHMGTDIQAYSPPVAFQPPQTEGESMNLAFTDIDAPRITDATLVSEAHSVVMTFKTSRPVSIWGSYPKKPAVKGENAEQDALIPRSSLSLDHRIEFHDLSENSVYPLELWFEDARGAGIRLTFSVQTRQLDPVLDTADSNVFSFDSTRQNLRVTDTSQPLPYEDRTIPKGSKVKLTWKSKGSRCEAFGGWSGVKPGTGSEIITPTSTAIYDLRCIINGIERRKSLSLTVVDPPDFSLTATKGERTSDDKLPITLAWDASFMQSCIFSHNGIFANEVPQSWSIRPTPLRGSEKFFITPRTVEFILECVWKNAPYEKRAVVSVSQPAAAQTKVQTQSSTPPLPQPYVIVSSTSTSSSQPPQPPQIPQSSSESEPPVMFPPFYGNSPSGNFQQPPNSPFPGQMVQGQFGSQGVSEKKPEKKKQNVVAKAKQTKKTVVAKPKQIKKQNQKKTSLAPANKKPVKQKTQSLNRTKK